MPSLTFNPLSNVWGVNSKESLLTVVTLTYDTSPVGLDFCHSLESGLCSSPKVLRLLPQTVAGNWTYIVHLPAKLVHVCRNFKLFCIICFVTFSYQNIHIFRHQKLRFLSQFTLKETKIKKRFTNNSLKNERNDKRQKYKVVCSPLEAVILWLYRRVSYSKRFQSHVTSHQYL